MVVTDSVTVKLADKAAKAFADVAATFWGKDKIDFTVARGLFQGTSETTFTPDRPITYAEIFNLLYRLDGGADVEPLAGLSQKDQWFAQAAGWAVDMGLVDNADGAYVALSRQALTVMIYRYAESTGMDMSFDLEATAARFTDASSLRGINQEAMLWCAANGIVEGNGNNQLNAFDTTTRAEAATILMNIIEFMLK